MTVEDRSSDGKKDTGILRVVSLQTHIHSPTQRLVLAVCIVLALAMVPHTAASAATSSDGWATQTSGTTSTLYGVWGTGPADVFAVGENATILHYDGVSWEPMNSGVSGILFSVWGSSSTDVFAVGENGVICHYDGASWSTMSSCTTKHLQGVWGTDNESVFAVGYSGTIVQYNGSSWENMTSNTLNHLKCIWGTSSSDLFAAGNGGQVLHYDGVGWSVILDDGHPNFMGIWGSASDNVFATGVGGMVLNYDGASWNAMATGVGDDLNSVWGASSTDVLIVGLDGTVLHYDGNAWAEMDSGVAGSLRSICGFSSSNAFAVGYSGTILHYKEMPPELSAVSPNQGNQGQTLDVVITGSNLDTVTSASFGSGITVNSFHVDGPGQITANITIGETASAGARDVLVTGTYGTGPLAAAFTVLPSASIASVSPSSGNQGQTLDVVISGANLDGTTGVHFGAGIAVNSFAEDSAESLSASITIDYSASVGARDVTVSAAAGTAVLTNAFSVAAEAPTIADISPRSVKAGQALSLSITGANLASATSVSLGEDIAVEGFTASPEQISVSIVVSADAALGPRDVSVATDGGTAMLEETLVVYRLPPGIVGISPASGKPGQTLDVVISGINFIGTTSVYFGEGIRINSFRVDSDTQIDASVTILDGAEAGLRDVRVVTAVGSVTYPGGFDLIVESTSGHASPDSSSDWSSIRLWVLVTLGAVIVGVSLFIVLLMRRKKDSAEAPPPAL